MSKILNSKANQPINNNDDSIMGIIRHNLVRMRKQKPFTLFVLFLVILAFAAMGIGDYVRQAVTNDIVATVGKQQLPLSTLEAEIESFVNYSREQKQDYSEEQLRSEPVIRQKLMEMIQTQLISQYIRDEKLIPSDAKLASEIATQPEFQENGAFSKTRYLEYIRRTRMSIDDFEENFRMRVARDNLVPLILQTSFLPNGAMNTWQGIIGETREVLPHSVVGEKFNQQIKVTAEDKQKYYEQNKNLFVEPVKIKTRVLEFSPLTLRKSVEYTDEELKAFYEENKANLFSQNKDIRNIRHILILSDEKATPEEKAKANENINDILKKIKANPKDFANLAKEFSQDPGSKNNGGLIENVERGMMVPEFDKVVFDLNEGDISDVVETKFGYHIIKLEKIISQSEQKFEDIKPQVIEEYKKVEALKKYNALLENFKLLIDEQSDDQEVLDKAAKEFDLEVSQSDWVDINTKNYPFDLADVKNVLFSKKALDKKVVRTNSKKEDKVFAFYITDKVDEKQLSIDDVSEKLEKAVHIQKIRELINKEVSEKLSKLNSGTDDLLWEKPINVNRLNSKLPQTVMSEIFSVPANSLPKYISTVVDDNKTVIYKINKIIKDEKFAEDVLQKSESVYSQYWQSRVIEGLIAALMEKYPVSINEEVLAKIINKVSVSN